MADCHEHKFVYLRQEKKNIGFDRNPRYLHEDVFFCERCLRYERVKVKETVPDPMRFDGEVTVG